MLHRVLTIALNTYREAVRARILHGLLGVALATCGYALVVGAYALKNQDRVVADLGAASISAYAVVVAIVLGATSLYRELELKTIFPILARPIERWEYLLGKFFGTVLTLGVFVGVNSGMVLFALGSLTTRSLLASLLVPTAFFAAVFVVGWRVVRLRTWLPIPVAVLLLIGGAFWGRDAVSESAVVLGQALLTMLEVSIVTAMTLVFAAFSSPFLTAVFSFSVFVVGRSADTLARLPARVFGEGISELGKVLSHVFPNLMVYVPPRTLFTGEVAGSSYWPYVTVGAIQAGSWCVGLLLVAALIFRRRDFL
jgi:Cu-processing system permease protein